MFFFKSFLISFLLAIEYEAPMLQSCPANTRLNSTELSANLPLPNATDNACPVTYNVTYDVTYVEVDVQISCSITLTICLQNGDVKICKKVFHIGHYKFTITVTDQAGNSASCEFDLWIIGEYLTFIPFEKCPNFGFKMSTFGIFCSKYTCTA